VLKRETDVQSCTVSNREWAITAQEKSTPDEHNMFICNTFPKDMSRKKYLKLAKKVPN